VSKKLAANFRPHTSPSKRTTLADINAQLEQLAGNPRSAPSAFSRFMVRINWRTLGTAGRPSLPCCTFQAQNTRKPFRCQRVPAEALTIKALDCQSFQTAQAQSHRSAGQTHFGGAVVGLVNAMAEHGHVDDALAYLNDPLPGDCFPLHVVNNLAREMPRR
jgi:hypothetical protein